MNDTLHENLNDLAVARYDGIEYVEDGQPIDIDPEECVYVVVEHAGSPYLYSDRTVAEAFEYAADITARQDCTPPLARVVAIWDVPNGKEYAL